MAVCLIALGAVWLVLNPAPVVQTEKEPVVKKTLAYQEAMAARDQEIDRQSTETPTAGDATTQSADGASSIEDVLTDETASQDATGQDLAALPDGTPAAPLPWADRQPAGAPPQDPQDPYGTTQAPGADPYGQTAPGQTVPGQPVPGQTAPGQNPYAANVPGQNPYAANTPGGQNTGRQNPPGQPAYPGQEAYGQDRYAQDPYAQDPYAQNPYGQDPYAQDPYAQDPYAQNPNAQDPYAQGADPEAPYGRHPYSQEPLGPDGQVARAAPNTFPGEPPYPGQDPYQDPNGASPPYPGQVPPQGQAQYPGQPPYGAQQGQWGGQNEEWVKVISAGTGMRNSASEDSPILFAFPYGRTLKVLSRNGEWVQVSDPNSSAKGWMLAHTLEPTVNPNAYARQPYYEEPPKERTGGLFRNFLNRAFGN